MVRPEIVMETPAAKQLEAAVQRKLAEFSYSTADDVVMAEYVVVMLANSKTPTEITAELTELIGEDMYDPIFTDWLFEELARQYGTPSTQSVPATESSLETPAKSSQAGTDNKPDLDVLTGGKIETVNDSRDPFNNHRNQLKRSGNGVNGARPSQGVFGQAVVGIKRPGGHEILKDTPPHRRPRPDESFAGGIIPTGPRSMDRDSRDVGRPKAMPSRIGGGMVGDRRDMINNGPRASHPSFTPMRPGFGPIADGGPKSILERVGVIGNGGNRPFPSYNFQGGFDNAQNRRMNEQLADSLNAGRPPMPPVAQTPFFNPTPGVAYQPQLAPNHQFPQHHFQHQSTPNAPTPQLFLANGQPYLPQHPLPHSLPPAGSSIPPMYQQMLMNVPTNPHVALSGQSPVFTPNQPIGFAPKQPVPSNQPSSTSPDLNLSPLPDKPTLRQECKYNLDCKDAWCPSSHCPPCGDHKTSMLLNFEPCETQLQCQDSGCPKAHVSPQQRAPKASIRIPVATPAPTPVAGHKSIAAISSTPAPSNNLTLCRFGAHCTRPDCHFTHPWTHNSSTTADQSGVDPNQAGAFSTIRCKFGLTCTRPNCHFQHPSSKKTVASPYRVPSKNISKTFHTSDTPAAIKSPAAGEASKLPPSKKFTVPTSDSTVSSNPTGEVQTKDSDVFGTELKPVLGNGSLGSKSTDDGKLIPKSEDTNGIQHQAPSDLPDIKPVLPVSVNASAIVS